MAEELKPCPCCGNEDVTPLHECNSNKPLYRVKCYVCGMQTHLDDKEKVIAVWNNRVEPIGNSDELPQWVKEAIQTKIYDMTRMFSNSNGCIKLAVEYEIAAYHWVLSLRKPESES